MAPGAAALAAVRAAFQQPATLVPRKEVISHIQHERAFGCVTSPAQRDRKIDETQPEVVVHGGDHELAAVRQCPPQRLVLRPPGRDQFEGTPVTLLGLAANRAGGQPPGTVPGRRSVPEATIDTGLAGAQTRHRDIPRMQVIKLCGS